MISERRFAKGYASIWQDIMPLSDGFWAVENLLTKHEAPPVKSMSPVRFRGFINELGFRVFSRRYANREAITRESIIMDAKDEYSDATTYIKRLAPDGAPTSSPEDIAAVREAAQIAMRLLSFFPNSREAIVRPSFKGCGIIGSCEGDLIYGNCLYEIKSGDRGFRVSDLRQLFIYCALAYSDNSLSFTKIGIFNPRTGMVWSKDIDAVCRAVSGVRANDLMPRMIEFFSASIPSR